MEPGDRVTRPAVGAFAPVRYTARAAAFFAFFATDAVTSTSTSTAPAYLDGTA